MDKRTFSALLTATSVSAVLPQAANATAGEPVRNVVLVHGLFADGSSGSEVITRLQRQDMNVKSVQNPLTNLEDAVAETQLVVARQAREQ